MRWVNGRLLEWPRQRCTPVRQRVELPQRDEPPGGSDSPPDSPWPCPLRDAITHSGTVVQSSGTLAAAK